jgi:hypothetical protein
MPPTTGPRALELLEHLERMDRPPGWVPPAPSALEEVDESELRLKVLMKVCTGIESAVDRLKSIATGESKVQNESELKAICALLGLTKLVLESGNANGPFAFPPLSKC